MTRTLRACRWLIISGYNASNAALQDGCSAGTSPSNNSEARSSSAVNTSASHGPLKSSAAADSEGAAVTIQTRCG